MRAESDLFWVRISQGVAMWEHPCRGEAIRCFVINFRGEFSSKSWTRSLSLTAAASQTRGIDAPLSFRRWANKPTLPPTHQLWMNTTHWLRRSETERAQSCLAQLFFKRCVGPDIFRLLHTSFISQVLHVAFCFLPWGLSDSFCSVAVWDVRSNVMILWQIRLSVLVATVLATGWVITNK